MATRDVTSAVKASDFPAALAVAVEVWREARHAALADLIDALAAKCPPVTIAGRDKATYRAAWLKLAKRAEPPVIGALAEGASKMLLVKTVSFLVPNRDLKRHRDWIERLEALAKLDDDPRVATALVDVIRRAPFSESRRLYEPVIALLVRISDERCVPALHELVERPVAKASQIREFFAEALPKAADTIERVKRRSPPAGVTELLATLGAGKRTATVPRADVAKLFAEVFSNPDDDAPREVLADALLEREDPRGELIALQLRGGEPKRIASLVRKHEKAWLGDLALVTKLRVWRRGFLDEAELQQHAAADDAMWERVAHDPQLATVRALRKGRANEDLYRSFVRSDAMRGLRDLEAPTTKFLGELVDYERPIERLTLHAGLPIGVFPTLDAVIEKTGVTRLAFETRETPDGAVAWLECWPGRAKLRELCVIPQGSNYQAWGADCARFLSAFDELAVHHLAVKFSMLSITCVRAARGIRADIEVTHDWGLESFLADTGNLEHVIIRGGPPPKVIRPELQRAIERLGSVELRDGWEVLRPRES